MALSRQGRGRRQVETVWTGMGFGQIAVLRVWPLGQLCIARVDLDYFDHLRELTAPSQPPPLVTALRRGDECDVTAVVSGYELAAEGTFVRYGILRDRGQRQQLGGADGEHGAAASLLVPPGPGGTRHAATVPQRCDFDTGVRHRAWSWSPGGPSPRARPIPGKTVTDRSHRHRAGSSAATTAPRTVRRTNTPDPEPGSQPAPQGRAMKPKPNRRHQVGLDSRPAPSAVAMVARSMLQSVGGEPARARPILRAWTVR
jgi:hypothetical protein